MTGAVAMQRTMHDAVDEVARVTPEEGIDCHLAKGGYLNLARTAPQVSRVHELLKYYRSWGFGEEDYRWLPADEASAAPQRHQGSRLGVHAALRGDPSGSPGARAWPRRSSAPASTIYEQTRVLELGDRKLRCETGTVSADVVVRATEGFTARLPGHRRTVAPIYSLMIATEPLPDSFFAEVGWAQRETFNDDRRLIIYGQRTADNRIAFGGRGAPYHFGSAIKPEFDRHAAVQDSLRALLGEMFPGTRRCQGHPSLGRTDRRAAGLVLLGRFRPGTGPGVGGRLRRRRGHHHEPRRQNVGRSHHPSRHRSGRFAMGQPSLEEMGT